MKIFFFFLVLFFCCYLLFSQDESGENNYNQQKLSMQIREHYDPIYPLNIKDFYFYQGEKQITLENLFSITGDKLLAKNQEKIKKIKMGGFTAAGILGGLAFSFLVPSIVFIAIQTNYQNIPSLRIDPDTGNEYNSWLDYYEDNYHSQFLPGLICIVLTCVTSFSLLIDFTVMFSLIYKHKNNHKLYRDVIERYNQKLKGRYSFIPEIGFNSFNEQNNLFLGLKINL